LRLRRQRAGEANGSGFEVVMSTAVRADRLDVHILAAGDSQDR
jgi:hypothetical protein